MHPGFASAAGRKVGDRAGGVEHNHGRQERRIPHHVPCRVRLYDGELGQPTALVGQTINLSNRGLAVRLGRRIPAGTWIEALVPHLDGDPTFVCGTVSHSRRVLADVYEIGIEFLDKPPEG